MNSLSVIIVDDEPHGRENLANLLRTHCPQVNVVALAGDAKNARDLIALHHPDAVFLDIMMPDMTGIELLQSMPARSFATVLVTGYSTFAIPAIKLDVADYLLKPIDITELKNCVAKLHARQRKQPDRIEPQEELEVQQIPDSLKTRIAVSHQDGFHLIGIDQIIYLQGDDNYTKIILTDGRTLLVSRTLKDFETMMPSAIFFRIHKSFLINLYQVKEYVSAEGGMVVMSNKSRLAVSRRKLGEFQEILKRLAIFP